RRCHALSPCKCVGFFSVTYKGSQPAVRKIKTIQVGLCRGLAALAKVKGTRRIRFGVPVLITFRQTIAEEILDRCAPSLASLRNGPFIDGVDRPQCIRREYEDSLHGRDSLICGLLFGAR